MGLKGIHTVAVIYPLNQNLLNKLLCSHRKRRKERIFKIAFIELFCARPEASCFTYSISILVVIPFVKGK